MMDPQSALSAVTETHAGGRIAVFAGSQVGINPRYALAARELGALLALHRLELVFGGTAGGLMEAVAEAAFTAGGTVIGVVPANYWPELHSRSCTILHQVADLRARKAKMATLAHAFIALPGGPGTLDELIEMVTLAHLNQHYKPIALCNVDGFFEPFLQLLDHLKAQGLVSGDLRPHLMVESSPALLLSRLFADKRWLFAPLPVERKSHDD